MAPRRSTRAGTVEGVRLDTVDAFLGIPYAAPPVGAHRWRAPQPVTPWSGTRPATNFGPSCWQPLTPNGFGPWTPEYVVQNDVSEDCLTLNVWTAADDSNPKRPVLVWIHGGAFCQGSGSVAIYNGRALASRGLVVVTINYRLGVLGFLAHPDLARESTSPEACTNFGLQDQIAALRWVRDNIEAFGGDPDAVTVAGQSAGAMSVHMLMACPQAAGLFQRAIALSGPPTLVPVKSREQAQAESLAFAAEVGAPDLRALRALSVQDLTRTLAPGPRFGPSVDGVLLPSWPPHCGPAPSSRQVPVLCGQTADENSGLDPHYGSDDPADFALLMQRYFGEQATPSATPSATPLATPLATQIATQIATQLAAHYLHSAPGRSDLAYRAAAQDRWLTALLSWAEHRARLGCAPMFAYLFEHVQPGPDAARYGAFHTSDVPYALATLDAAPQRPFTDVDRRICAITSGYWLNFVKHGNPNGHGLPHWPALDPRAPVMLRIGERVEPGDMFTPWILAMVQQLQRSAGAPTVLA